MASNLPTDPVPDSNAALWLAVGRLQSDTARLIEGQAELRTDLAESNRQTNQQGCFIAGVILLRRMPHGANPFYSVFPKGRKNALIGVGAGVIGTLVAVLLRGG